MPVRKIQLGSVRREDKKLQDLKQRLMEEWSSSHSTIEPRADIREEVDSQGRAVHLYVIWSEWGEMDHQRRSEVIMDAFIDVHGAPAAEKVSVAMGITPQEATRMGIDN